MPIRVVVNTHADDATVDELTAYWREKCRTCEGERGNLQYEVFRSITHPENFALLELWADQESYDEHWAAELARKKPLPERAPRRVGRDGVEFYFDQRYYVYTDGRWQPKA